VSFGAPGNEVLRASYVLEAKLLGMDAATRADREMRASTTATTNAMKAAAEAASRMSSRQATAWKSAASIASEQSRRIADAHVQATRRIDSSITGTVKKMREMGVGYEGIARYMRAYRADAEQTAAAIERSSAKELAAIERVGKARERLRGMVGLGPSAHAQSAGYAREQRGIERGVVGAVSERARYGMGMVSGGLLGGIAGYVGIQGIKDAATHTTELAKQAMILHQYAGLSNQSALEFAAVSQAYGVSSTRLAQTFRILGTTVDKALTSPTKSTTKVFRDLGLTQQEVASHAHDLGGMLGIIADHLNKMPPGAQKTADAAKLLGRSWQSLLPLLSQGSVGMRDQLAEAKALGVEMGGNSAANAMKLHEAMVRLQVAQLGLEVQFTEHILPALMKFMLLAMKAYEVIRTNLAPVFRFLGGEVHDVSRFFREHQTILKGVEVAVTGLVAAYAGLKVISFATRLVRGIGADMSNFVKLVTLGTKSLFEHETAEQQLMRSNAALAESNIKLAASFDLISGSAKGAAGAEALGGAGGGLGGTVGKAERGLMGGATEAQGLTTVMQQETRQRGVFSALFGRTGAATMASKVGTAAGAAETAAPTLLGRVGGLASGLGGKLLGGLGIAGMGMMGAQLAGSFIPGTAGHVIGSVGSSAALGASVGSFGGPWGTAIGGALGAAYGMSRQKGPLGAIGKAGLGAALGPLGFLVGPLEGLLGPSEQQQRAQSLLKDTQAKINAANEGTLASLQHRYTLALHDGGLTRSQAQAEQAALTARGLQIAAPSLAMTMQNVQSSQYRPSAAAIAGSTAQDLANLPGQSQRIGAEAMIQFTAGMEANKKLPLGTTDKLIADLESRYGPKLAARLGADSSSSMRAISDAIRQSDALRQTQTVVDGIHQKWSLLIPATKVNADNYVSTISADLKQLQQISKTSHGQMHADAVAAIKALRGDAASHFAAMEQDTVDKIIGMKKAIVGGSKDAANQATSSFNWFVGQVQGAMAQGLTTTSGGMAQIDKALQQELTGLGAPSGLAKTLAGMTAKTLATNKLPAQTLGKFPGQASGGRVPGAVGPDNWLLVDPSGRPAAAVGGGEILVANRHTEARVDSMLAAFGTSLGGEVASETRMHSLAFGGRLGTSPAEALPVPRQYLNGKWSLDQGVDIAMPAHTPEYAVGPGVIVQEGIQGFGPWAPILKVTTGPLAGMEFYYGHAGPNLAHVGQHVLAGQQITQVGAGRVGISTGPHIEFGLWPPRGGAVVASLLRGLESVAGAADFGAAAAGITAPTISAPKVKGSGALTNVVQAALSHTASAANAYLQRQTGALGGLGTFSGQGGAPSANQTLGRKMMLAAGFGANQWPYLQALWTQESGWNANAVNPSSGAYGIPQALGHGHPYNLGDAAAQIAWGLNYIKGRYGSPQGAEAHERAFNWYARGGRIARAATGVQNLGYGWQTNPSASRSHRPATVSMHLNPFTGTYQMMTGAQARSLRDAYIAKYGHPYRPSRTRHVRAQVPHMRLDPFTGRYEMLTASQEAALKDAYIRKFGHPYHAPPKSRTRRSASTLHQEAAQVAAGNAVGLTSGFDLGYEAAISPGVGSGITTLAEALSSAISGVGATPTGGSPLRYHYALGGRIGARGIRVHAGHSTPHTNLGAIRRGTHQTRGVAIRPGHGVHVAVPRTHVGGGTKVVATSTFGYDWATDPSASSYTAIVDPSAIYSGGALGGGEVPILAGSGDYGAGWGIARGAARTIGASIGRVATGGTSGQLSKAMSRLSASIDDVSKVSYNRLQSLADQITRGIKRVGSGSAEGKRLGNALQLVDYQMGKRAGTLVAAAENQASALAGAQTRLQRVMTRQNISTSSGKAASMMEAFAAQSVAVLRSTVTSLQKALGMAKKAKDKNAVADITTKLGSAMDALDQAVTDQIQARYDAVTNTAAEAVAGAQQWQTSVTNAQTIAGTQGTAGAATQMADNLRQAIIPALSASLGDLNQKLQAAVAIGDTGMQKTVQDAINSTTSALAQATADLRTSIEDAAAAGVASATHTASMADLGEQDLTIRQQLGNYAGTARAGQEMAAYINSTVLPALATEATALQNQYAAAKSVGDQTLADQIAEAIAAKNNAIDQAKLDALNAIRDSTAQTTQDLQQLSGATGLDFNGQPFTDNISALVGA
jgi:Peptidase family M23